MPNVTIGRSCGACQRDSWRISTAAKENKLVCAVCNPPGRGRRSFPKRTVARQVHSSKPEEGLFSITDPGTLEAGAKATIEKHSWGYKVIVDGWNKESE